MSRGGVGVVGAGGHAKVVIATLQAMGEEIAGAFSSVEAEWGSEVLAVPVLGAPRSLAEHAVERAVVAIGDNRTRRRVVEELKCEWVTARHPRGWIHASVSIGEGTVVAAGAILQPDVRVGRHAIVNTAASIDHDCEIGDFAHVCPGAHLAGSVVVAVEAMVGVGASVLPGVRIGVGATVGAGSVVVRDVPDGQTVAGNPARAIG